MQRARHWLTWLAPCIARATLLQSACGGVRAGVQRGGRRRHGMHIAFGHGQQARGAV